jgi:hypothetical protein
LRRWIATLNRRDDFRWGWATPTVQVPIQLRRRQNGRHFFCAFEPAWGGANIPNLDSFDHFGFGNVKVGPFRSSKMSFRSTLPKENRMRNSIQQSLRFAAPITALLLGAQGCGSTDGDSSKFGTDRERLPMNIDSRLPSELRKSLELGESKIR